MIARVSICLPNLNTRRYLDERIETILAQTFTDWELIVSDNYSADGAWEIFQKLARGDPRVSVFQSPREGMYANWNRSIERARGEFVYIATSDDTMAPDCLAAMIAALEANPGCDLAHCPLREIDEHGRDLPDTWRHSSVFARSSGPLLERPHIRRAPYDGLLHLAGDTVYVSITQLLIRRSLFGRVGLFSGRWGSVGDFAWDMRAGLVANTIHVPGTWAAWRVHGEQATAAAGLRSPEHAQRIEAMIRDALDFARRHYPAPLGERFDDRWLRATAEHRAFDHAIGQRRDAIRRRAFIAARLCTGSAPAWEHARSKISGRRPWREAYPQQLACWMEEAGFGPALLPAPPAIVSQRPRTPRILYVSPYWPHRGASASEQRALNIGRALADVGRVEMLVVDAEGGEAEWIECPDKEFRVAGSVAVHPKRNRGLYQKLRWALNPKCPYPHGRGVDQDSLIRVLRVAAGFDLLWFCKMQTPNMFPRWAWPRSFVDIDDVPSTYEWSVLQTTLPPRDRLLTLVRYWSWRRRERLLGERFSALGVCSEADERYLRSLGVNAPVHVIPNGACRPQAVPARNPADPPRLGFIGTFDYPPNPEGLRWFTTNCWPRIKCATSGVRLRVVGRFSDGPLRPVGAGIDALGWVPDIEEEVATWSAMIVPIQVGGGTRGKIAQAFSLKCPVVSTSIGAYGYDAVNGRTMYLADAPEDFARACLDAIQRPAEAAAMAERAWTESLEKWTWDAIRPRVHAAVAACLELPCPKQRLQ